MATTLITRETPGGGATVKNAPLTNEEVDNNFITLADNKVEIIEGTVAVIPNGTTAERPATPSVGMLRFNTTESAFEGYNGTEWGTIGGGGGVAYTFQTANYTAEAGEGVLTDTTGGAFTVTLPAAPEVGATVVVADAGGAWGTNNLTVGRNGETISGDAEDLVLDIDGVSVTLVYDGTTWEVYAQAGVNSASGGGIAYTFQTANYATAPGEGVLTDTTGGSFTVTLPPTPDVGDTVVIADAGGAWGTNPLTIARNGSTIDDVADDLNANIDGVSITLVYDGTTWEVYAQAGVNTSSGPTISDDTTSTADFYPTLAGDTSGQFSEATVSSTKLFFQPSTGTLNATEFNSLSDVAVKSNISEINNGLDVVNALSGVEFDWTDNGNHSAGVIAQELERVLPHLVSTSDEGMKSVNYAGLTAYLLSAIKELSNKIK